ncbi:hypothetical protein [Streptomyces sp. NBC_01197]|uniref:hypothetical protein n=1 Tax=Streptomyces sp. NBC_01197 TaxID=2903768 RepID=UPI002E1429EA|nr:hypothetical protein OG452_31115 [Streptomyces sp. NBC_01197]
MREVVLDHGGLPGPVVAEQGGGEEFGVQMLLGVGQAGLKTMAISSTSARVMPASDRQ